MGEVAIHASEIESRLKSISVFAIMDIDRTFLFTTGHSKRCLCPFFLNREMAELYESSLVTKCPDMIQKTCVIETGLDQVFKFISNETDESIIKNVNFRFIPDPKEVLEALEVLHKTEKNKVHSDLCIEGIPLFHSRSLELKPISGSTRVLPLFFSKNDIDLAIANAKRTEKKIRDKNYEIRIEGEKTTEIRKKPYTTSTDTTIEVGCLEWVLQQMGEDEKGVWTEILFIPPGFMSSTPD